MVRLSSPLSSRLILAGSYAGIAGLVLYGIIFAWSVDEYGYAAATNYNPSGLDLAILSLQAMGPVFGVFITAIPFFPFTFAYASSVCPSRITITDTEIRAKFFSKEKRWPMAQLTSVKFQTTGQSQFIILNVAGKTLKAEVEHGRWGPIRDLIPHEIADTVATENNLRPQQVYAPIGTLSYSSEDEFEDDYRAEIYQQAKKLAEDYCWWNEPLWLYDQLRSAHKLTGQSQLWRSDPVDPDGVPILGQGIPARYNALMSFIDAQRIIGLLQVLSKEHEITWTLYENDGRDEIGIITNGAIDPQLDYRLNAIRESNGFSDRELQDDVLQKRIRSTYTAETSPSFSDTEYLPPEQEIDSSRRW